MRYAKGLSAVIFGLAASANTFAGNVSINGTIPAQVVIHPSSQPSQPNGPLLTKEILFERVILSPAAHEYLVKQIENQLRTSNLTASATSLPPAALVGMNGVPVLDQGQHGTCVTFAVTGALDAVADDAKTDASYDRYSELCSLELGSTLEQQNSDYPSGWDGSWGTLVLDQISKHGLITKKYQQTQGCAGVREYPQWNEADHGKPMSLESFDGNSEKIVPPLSYKIIMKPDDAFSDRVNPDEVLTKIKTALADKHRVTFGTLLDVKYGINGAVGTYKMPFDTWVLTAQIAKDAKHPENIEAGHEMIIIGYDDNAQVKVQGESHKGVLTLRNSWGNYAGDHGNYYMTYDHFKALVLEVAEYIPADANTMKK